VPARWRGVPGRRLKIQMFCGRSIFPCNPTPMMPLGKRSLDVHLEIAEVDRFRSPDAHEKTGRGPVDYAEVSNKRLIALFFNQVRAITSRNEANR
jgi:hypothetical protein